MAINAPDLRKQPPRSVRVRLGGYAILPRLLDKTRAAIVGTLGEYIFNCPTDQVFLNFVGLDAEALKREAATGKGDWEMLEWIKQNAKHKRDDAEVLNWSDHAVLRAPNSPDSRDYFSGEHRRIASHRTDLVTWADLLDLDDYVSFGGKA